MTVPAKCPCCSGQATLFDDGYVQCDEDYCIWTSKKTTSGGCSHPPSAPDPPKARAVGGYTKSLGGTTFTVSLTDLNDTITQTLQESTQKVVEASNQSQEVEHLRQRALAAERLQQATTAAVGAFLRELYEWTQSHAAASSTEVALLREMQRKLSGSGWM